MGFQIESVHDGESGLLRALSVDHCLAVLDYMLPGLNGLMRKIEKMADWKWRFIYRRCENGLLLNLFCRTARVSRALVD